MIMVVVMFMILVMFYISHQQRKRKHNICFSGDSFEFNYSNGKMEVFSKSSNRSTTNTVPQPRSWPRPHDPDQDRDKKIVQKSDVFAVSHSCNLFYILLHWRYNLLTHCTALIFSGCWDFPLAHRHQRAAHVIQNDDMIWHDDNIIEVNWALKAQTSSFWPKQRWFLSNDLKYNFFNCSLEMLL